MTRRVDASEEPLNSSMPILSKKDGIRCGSKRCATSRPGDVGGSNSIYRKVQEYMPTCQTLTQALTGESFGSELNIPAAQLDSYHASITAPKSRRQRDL